MKFVLQCGLYSLLRILWCKREQTRVKPPISSSVVSTTYRVGQNKRDAGFRLNQKEAAVGVVIRDENGEIMGLVAKSLTLFFQAAEAVADISALTWSAKEIAKEFHARAFHFIGQFGNKTAHAMVQEGSRRMTSRLKKLRR
ncbi:hypothetical protein Goari_009926, partial [Gossypium aridum]|nr:hypothetical protein [Gossypium aridum]